MYNENSFKDYLFWIKVKRIFVIIAFSIIGCIIGIITSSFVVDVLLFNNIFRILIVGALTLLFFTISLLGTSNVGKEIQDGYWKIATLRKLTLISKKLDSLEKLDNLDILNDLITENLSKIKSPMVSKEIDEENVVIDEDLEITSKKVSRGRKPKASV